MQTDAVEANNEDPTCLRKTRQVFCPPSGWHSPIQLALCLSVSLTHSLALIFLRSSRIFLDKDYQSR